MASTIGIRLSRTILMVRNATDVANAVNFYQNGLGLTVVRHTDEWAELACAAGTDSTTTTTTISNNNNTIRLSIKTASNEAQLSVGYSPILSFDVTDMDGIVSRCAQMGGHLDGPIQYPAHGKVAALRSPQGHMIGLYEPAL
uniref:VOC domain-containing protein n=1 Tax=Helicotheca tamesis TaxID=374047 RepID=A0A7S2HIP9_9STRA|eukprot:CAMPEP_0185726282 /NCGR_PEP_ID=MMETSP1171-20130828/2314_1 /TAXON_ID=374046 /ORGANISM="Helicotheca tamensis, Strain CCMP826" /LENGTH=141 /DNA_ID=CAMNT_0028394603 /DNA_START=23 /DNA_END=448 /DNA_ORIENTATION=-